MTLCSINPSNNQIIAEYQEYPIQRVKTLLAQSEIVFGEWKKTGFEERSAKMSKLSELLKTKSKVLAKTITQEMGKPIKESIAEVNKCAWVCQYYADNAQNFLKEETISTDARQSFVRCDPLGPILAIMPWNFPFWQVFRFAAPAIMAGNVGILKHASNVQGCARNIEDLFKNAGFPEHVFQNLAIGSGKVKQVIENNIVKAVTLTGSETAGSKVAALAGSLIKKTVLELGGSNAFIVLEDADLEKAAEVGIMARFLNAGQSCIAAKRFILQKSIADKFLGIFLEKAKKLKVGDPMEETTDIGPLASMEQAKILENQVLQSVEKGAEIIYGGKRENAYYHPTVMTNVMTGMPVMDEELFGPVAPMCLASDKQEAVSLANRSNFGLGVTIFTSDIEKAKTFLPEFEDGAVFVNELVKSDPRLPFGGTKKSGYGRELSHHGIREFVNIKTIFIK